MFSGGIGRDQCHKMSQTRKYTEQIYTCIDPYFMLCRILHEKQKFDF